MADDNNRDARQKSRKDARREARIEEKRRKLAEQRASRQAGSEGAGNGRRSWYDADRQVIDPAGSDAGNVSGEVRQVTADSNNTERRILIEKYSPEDQVNIQGGQQEGASPDSAEAPSDHIKSTAGAAAGAAKSAASAVKPVAKSALGGIWHLIKRFFSWFFKGIWHSLQNMTPGYAIRLLLAIVVLIGLIYGALHLADYYDKKTDIFITDEGFVHAEQFGSSVVLNGIDVSVHQKGDIDWKKVKTSGADFVFVRVGYRAADDGSLHADENFEKNYKGAKKAGLMVGVYFYSQALTPLEGREEAEFVLDILKKRELTLPVAIDYEIYKDGRLDKKIDAGELYAASFYHDIVLGFTERIEKAGYESLVYANRDMLTNYMQADLIDDMADIWLARYDKVANLDADYWFWQCTDEGKVGGIEGNVDHDFWYMEPNKVYETRGKRGKKAISVRDCRISFKRSSFEIHNFRAEPKYGFTYGDKGLKEGRDYVASVVHNTQPGTGYVIIRGIGKYKDWIMYPFTIE